jgi:hypothetical protein
MGSVTSDRRQHVVYITKNNEYHCRDRECVGVKNRTDGIWQSEHPALRGRLLGGIQNGEATKECPEIGWRMVFGKDTLVMTTQVLFKGRPDRECIFAYTSLCRAGEIRL